MATFQCPKCGINISGKLPADTMTCQNCCTKVFLNARAQYEEEERRRQAMEFRPPTPVAAFVDKLISMFISVVISLAVIFLIAWLLGYMK